jgi:hypothetical protein
MRATSSWPSSSTSILITLDSAVPKHKAKKETCGRNKIIGYLLCRPNAQFCIWRAYGQLKIPAIPVGCLNVDPSASHIVFGESLLQCLRVAEAAVQSWTAS